MPVPEPEAGIGVPLTPAVIPSPDPMLLPAADAPEPEPAPVWLPQMEEKRPGSQPPACAAKASTLNPGLLQTHVGRQLYATAANPHVTALARLPAAEPVPDPTTALPAVL
eukprot:3657-Rhodomonas_salina.1